MNKRLVTGGLITALTLAVTAGCSSGNDGGDGAGDTVLNLMMVNHPWVTIVQEHLPEFEAETGITVNLEAFEVNQLEDQFLIQANAGTSDVDVVMYRAPQQTTLFGQNNFVVDLSDRVTANAEWDWNDFLPSMREQVTYDGDQILGVPIINETEVLYYRTDVLEQLNIEVPDTFEELEAAAAAVQEANLGMAGYVSRTTGTGSVTQFSSFLYGFGGDFLTGGQASVDSPEAKEAYAYYGRMIREYGPETVGTDMEWPEAMAIFNQGGAAFYPDVNSIYNVAVDPEQSTISENVGVAPFPAGPAGRMPFGIAAFALAIPEPSENQDAAWQFIEWATSHEMLQDVQDRGGSLSSRESNLGTDNLSILPDDVANAIQVNFENAMPADRPQVVDVTRARELVGNPIVVAIRGGDSDTAADEANAALQALIDSENR